MDIFEEVYSHQLSELLGQIQAREAALPDFQRDFVWEPNATQELVVSIAAKYPAGSLLRIRNTNDLFACREFQGAPLLNDHKPTYLILDGQQRLTSLFQAFYGKGSHRFYLNIQDLIAGKEFDECIFHLRVNLRRVKELESPDLQARLLILPLSILSEPGGFSKWSKKVARTREGEERNNLEDLLGEIEETYIKSIEQYDFPVVTLSDKASADAVCTIFETLNRTGVKLTVFELLTARFWHQNINLRQLWAQAKQDHPILAEFLIDPYYVLQAISLVNRATPSCKRSDVLDLTAEAIRTNWDRVVKGMAAGLRLLRDDCGVLTAEWVPYFTMIVPLAALLARYPLEGGPHVAERRQRLTRWFWCSVFGQTYENAPNSQTAKDVGEVSRWLEGGAAPESVQHLRFDPAILREATPRQRAIYRGVIALMLRQDPRDFHTGEKLTRDLIIERHYDDHHIFPQAYLDKKIVPPTLRDCVLNRTLIDSSTNRRINDHAPSVYLQTIAKALKSITLADLLSSHILPTETDSPLQRDAFEEFLEWRQLAFWEQIEVVTGATQPTELLETGGNASPVDEI